MRIRRTTDTVALIIAIAVCEIAGAIGGLFTAMSVTTWYRTLAKPTLTPPDWLFAPVWTALYALMGVAAWLVWRSEAEREAVKLALVVFGAQLVLNIMWSAVFFGLQTPALAFAEIVVLWAAVLAATAEFFRISRAAGVLMLPYLLWVTFAAVLNFEIARLNP